MSNVWNLNSKNNTSSMPFAGTSQKIAAVSSREAYLRDHHRNLFGNDKQAFFNKGKVDYTTT